MQSQQQEDQIRKDQEQYGRRQGDDDGKTLSRAVGRGGIVRKPRQERRQDQSRGKSKKASRVLEGHEQEIKQAVYARSIVLITLSTDGSVYEGVVEKFDKYSIKLKTSSVSIWLFKNSFESMVITENKAAA